MIVGPQRDRVALLFIGGPEQDPGQEQQDQRDDSAPLGRLQWLLLKSRGTDLVQFVGQQRARGQRIDVGQQRDGHADAGGTETPVPADLLAERAAHQGSQEGAEIDADIED